MRRFHWNRDRLKRYQEKRLRAVIRNAYESVPFYRELFKKNGIAPDDIREIKDLEKIPVIRKEDFKRESPKRLVSTKFDVNKLKMLRTSGSTGEPFKFYICGREDDWRKAIYLRANISCGQRPRDRWVVITAPHHFFDTTRVQRKIGVFAQTCISVFMNVGEQAKLVREANPHVLDGYSGSLFLLAKEVDRMGLSGIRPRIVFGTADFIGLNARHFIEDVFQASFYDQFGCAEVDRTAWQCPEKAGYHMDVDTVITQFVDSDGKEVSAGERGEIVYTSLFNYAQPFIRYSVGDVGVPLDEECSCNRKLPLMQIVEGRRDSFLILPDGRLLSPMNFWAIMHYFESADEIDRFQVVQKKPTLIKIYIEVKKSFTAYDHLEKKLVKHVQRCLGIGDSSPLDLDVIFVEDIPKDKAGRLRSVISELPELPSIL